MTGGFTGYGSMKLHFGGEGRAGKGEERKGRNE